ncbi:hypothetical protein [Paenibacillus thalictri]|uniref:DUF5011 domain-containing protein n=1 Tax=Paenibacillus thalictri TaxID=2527873 RepID=A0A4Q9DRV7_9BACL|nr:hypothetical protein [Paenibacillus thalictri]TBL79544.1 hypothetical protein EYB31_11615 [Paenibacillus thalictri]
MKLGKGLGKIAGLMAAVLLLAPILSAISPQEAKAAGEYEDRYVYVGAKIMNNSSTGVSWGGESDYASNLGSYNMWSVFYNQAKEPSKYPGIWGKSEDGDWEPGEYDDDYANGAGVYTVDGHFWAVIDVKQIPALKALADGKSAKYRVKARLNSTTSNGAYIWAYASKNYDYTGFELDEKYSANYQNATSKFEGYSRSTDPDRTVDSGWLSFNADDYIVIQTETNDGGTQVEDIVLSFGDFVAPVLSDYTFTSDGTERVNNAGQQELFLKNNESLQLQYNFSKPVRATNLAAQVFDKHFLYTVPDGQGLPTDNQTQGMSMPDGFYDNSISYNRSDADTFKYIKQFPYAYKASVYHHTGNNPIGNGGELETKFQNALHSMKDRLAAADFHDAAGNPLTDMSSFLKANPSSQGFLSNRTVNPFDYNHGGYRIIVDAVPPQYNLTGNGITPEIPSGLVLNEGKEIEFTVQLTEDTVVKDGLSTEGLYLLFNNGMKAKYAAQENTGPNTKLWKFKMTIPVGLNVETPLLKAIALTHEAKGTDTGVIQDYAGNLLMDEANKDRAPSQDPSQAVPYTKIDWANLSIDNTPPEIGFRYSPAGVSGTVYGKSGKITIDATDPDIKVPALDPDRSVDKRPSKGIYRPGNMTGVQPGQSPEVGLVYYTWSQSPADPFAGKEEDRFAAIKRYSLTAKQPGEDLYPGNTVTLKVVNNKTNTIEPPAAALTEENSGAWYLHTWTADMTWDSARELMQYGKMKAFKAANAANFNGWIAEYKMNNPGASDADAEKYAQDKAMVQVGNYSEWPLDDFKQDDSNWTYEKGTLLLDNKKPKIDFGALSGNNTPEVKVQVTVTDEHSGVGTKQFQWVKQGAEPQEIDWSDVPASGEITTFNHVPEDGAYQLAVKAVDKAGNQIIEKMSASVTVDSSVRVNAAFDPEMNGSYTKSPEVRFAMNGINVENVRYAVTGSSAPPADYPSVAQSVYGTVSGSVYGTVSNSVYGGGNGLVYVIPADPQINGTYGVYVKVKEAGTERYYTYSKQYLADNEAPQITFSKNGVSYPSEQQRVVVTVTDRLSGVALKKYQWLRADAEAPAKESGGWVELPGDGAVTIDSTRLSPGETADFMLYVLGEDAAGNSAVAHTGAFKVSRKPAAEVPAAANSDLLYIYEEVGNGYTAVVRLNLENPMKEGYKYAISTDGGVSWSRWLPYTNFIEVGGLKDRNSGHFLLKAKFRSPGGAESAAVSLNASSVSIDEPVYAIATHSTLRPVKPENFVLELKVPAGIRAVPSAGRNPSEPTRKGNKFSIAQNGVYSFDLTDLSDSSRTDTLLVVVDNLDSVLPVGSIEYSMTASTNSHVIARLETSKHVKVLNNEGRFVYTFNENGNFTFMFEDEAGNAGSVTAAVYNIDKTPPEARVVRSYAYGENGGNTFKTIQDGSGQVLLSQGVVLNVEKPNAEAKNFQIVRGTNGTVLYQNGEGKFTIVDDAGNSSVVSDEISTIVPYLPDPASIKYEFVDDDGNVLQNDRIVVIDGVKVAKGKMKITLSGRVQAPNQVFLGTAPAKDGYGDYTNLLSDANGNYSYSKIYAANGETALAISDVLGNVNKLPIVVQGLDNKPPVITLNKPIAFVERNKPNFNALTDLGGFTVTDDRSKPGNIAVEASYLDSSKIGGQTVTYTARDEAGNISTAEQKVYVLPGDGLMILGNDLLISASQSEKVLFDTNVVNFKISRYNLMDVAGETLVNERGTYDVFYQSGLYREGQMKYVAQGLSLEELLKKSFTVEFPKTGWYTLIVRTQEREREYTTFFIGNMGR